MARIGLTRWLLAGVYTLAGCAQELPLSAAESSLDLLDAPVRSWRKAALMPAFSSKPLALVPSIQRAARFLPIENQRALLVHRYKGLFIFDLTDATQPKMEGRWNARPFETGALYYVAKHVLVLAEGMSHYTGSRDDLNLPKNQRALLNIDLRDPARPTLVEELVPEGTIRDSVLRGSSLFTAQLLGTESQLVRYELQDGRLVQSAKLSFEGTLDSFAASSDWLVITLQSPARVIAFDMTGVALRPVLTAGGSGSIYKTNVSGDRLQVLRAETEAAVIETFDLRATQPGPIGRCELRSGPEDRYVPDVALTPGGVTGPAYDAGVEQLEHVELDASGNCLGRHMLSPSGRRYALHAPDSQRLLALGAYQLNLYDTSPAADPAPLGIVGLYTPFNVSQPEPSIQVSALATPAAADDGTPEPWLVGLAYYGSNPIGRFQLASMSDQTLTPRATIDDPEMPEAISLIGSSLVTLSATQLRMFDISDLDAPRELGSLVYDGNYGEPLQFGEYTARTRSPSWWGTFYWDDSPPYQLQIFAPARSAPVASVTLDPRADLVRAGNLIINFDYYLWSWENREAYTHFAAYDLSDPTRPRLSAQLSTHEVGGTFMGSARWPEVSFRYESVGQALVFPQLEQPFSFDVVDFSDADVPVVRHLALPDRQFKPHSYFRSGTTIYATQWLNGSAYGTAVDFSDPASPAVDMRRAIPGYVVGASQGAVFTSSRKSGGMDFCKIAWGANDSQLLAATKLPAARVIRQIIEDDAGHLFVLHARDSAAPWSNNPRDRWLYLHILDAQTLKKVGVLAVDDWVYPLRLVDGQLLIDVSGATLALDLRDEKNPRLVAVQP